MGVFVSKNTTMCGMRAPLRLAVLGCALGVHEAPLPVGGMKISLDGENVQTAGEAIPDLASDSVAKPKAADQAKAKAGIQSTAEDEEVKRKREIAALEKEIGLGELALTNRQRLLESAEKEYEIPWEEYAARAARAARAMRERVWKPKAAGGTRGDADPTK